MWLLRNLLLLILSSTTMAQTRIAGTVQDSRNSEPLTFVNIGIPGENLGTLSNENGLFILEYDESEINRGDSVLFSMLGYRRKSFSIGQLQEMEQVSISLEPNPLILRNIHINAKKRFKRQHLGWMKGVRDGTLPTDTSKVGAAVVMLFESKEAPFLLDYLLLRLTYNNKDTFRLRLRVFDIDPENGGPGNDILGRQIFITGDKRIGWAKLDLRDQLIIIPKEKFYIGVEWIESRENRIAFIESMKEWNRWKLTEYLNGNDKAVVKDTVNTADGPYYNVVYNGDMRDWSGFDLLPPMTAVGVTGKILADKGEYVSYQRTSSFAPWMEQAWHLGLAIKISY